MLGETQMSQVRVLRLFRWLLPGLNTDLDLTPRCQESPQRRWIDSWPMPRYVFVAQPTFLILFSRIFKVFGMDSGKEQQAHHGGSGEGGGLIRYLLHLVSSVVLSTFAQVAHIFSSFLRLDPH
jgi:hypothetical protein